MKKKIIVLAVLISFGSSSLFAKDFWGFGSKGASYAADVLWLVVGGGLASVPLFDSGLNEWPYNVTLWATGGSIALVGLIGLFYDLATPDSDNYAMFKNPLPDVISITSDGKSTFIGAKFSFK
jgi:hypothetical protein